MGRSGGSVSYESLGKKMARVAFWDWVRLRYGSRFQDLDIGFYGGPEGGDVSTLAGLRHPRHRQVAIEWNPDAAYALQCRYPDLTVFCGDSAMVDDRFDVLFLDGTTNLEGNPEWLRAGVRSLRRRGSFFAFAVERAREMTRMEYVRSHAQTFDRACAEVAAQLDISESLVREVAAKNPWLDELSKPAVAGVTRNDIARVALFGVLIRQTLVETRIALSPELLITYNGQKVGSRVTTPMLVAGFEVVKLSTKTRDITKIRRRVDAIWGGDGTYDALHIPTPRDTYEALDWVKWAPDAYLKLNLPQASVAAYRAHKTMRDVAEAR